MIANVPSTLRFTLAAAAILAGAWKLTSPAPEEADLGDTQATTQATTDEMAATVRVFYATRDASLAEPVQTWLTQSHEGNVDLAMYDEVMQLSREKQLEACLSIDDHDGELSMSIQIADVDRKMQAVGTNSDVVECVETIVSSLDITGEGKRDITMRYWHGRVLDVVVER